MSEVRASGRDTSHLPWGDDPQPADLAIIAGIAAYGLYSLALWPVAPKLLAPHPLLLEWISGSTLSEVTVGALSREGQVPLVVALLAGIPASMCFDWAYWWAGHRWGDRSLHLLLGRRAATPKGRARIARVERMAARFGPAAVVLAYYLPLPNVLVYAAAGLAGMRLRTLLVLDALGVLLWTGLTVGLGFALGHHAVTVVDRVNHYSTIISLVSIAVVVLVVTRRRRG